MRKFIRILKIVVGAVGWVAFVIPVVFSGIFNIGNGAGMLFFGVLFLWGGFDKKLHGKAKTKKWAKKIILFLDLSILLNINQSIQKNTLVMTNFGKRVKQH